MATSAAQKSKARAVLRHQCGSCNEIFTGKTCPNCGEESNIFRVNADGVPIDEVANAVGASHSLPLRLGRSPELFDSESAMDVALDQQFKDVIREANLDKVKTLAADQAAKRIRSEEELEATKKGFLPPEQGGQQPEEQGGFASMSPGIFLQALGGWDPEQREQFLNQLASNPMLALNLSMMMNPGKAGNMNQMGGMMNPMAMMGQMMQPQVEQAPPASAADMLTAVIGAVGAIKEMSGGDNEGSSKQMDRLLDKMDEMRRETEDLKLKLIESEHKQTGIGAEEVRVIIGDALARNSENHANIQEGVKVLKDLEELKTGMVGLGLMQEIRGGDERPSIEQQRLDQEIKVEDKRDARDHELKLEAEKAAAARSNVQSEFMNSILTVAQQNHAEEQANNDDDGEGDSTGGETYTAEPRQTAVIS